LQLAGNPVSNQFRLYATSSRPETMEIQVFNGSGQVVVTRKFTVSAGTTLLEIPASNLPSGTYIIRATMGNLTQESFRVIKR
jgi:hypothetical protein